MGRRFEEFGFSLHEDRNIIPADDTTLFVCSGMQQLKPKFKAADGTAYGSLQSCIRTNDIDLIGDGSHLTSFVMVGNFSFKGQSYGHSVDLWAAILWDLFEFKSYDMVIHVHPDRPDHKKLWDDYNFHVVDDPECVWSDGDIGGHCCEVFYKGREYICRRLLRRMMQYTDGVGTGVCDWIMDERELLRKRLVTAKRAWKKNQDKPPEWWWDTFGIMAEEILHLSR